ncbi:MAG: allene oxide cyclase family protein [Anaerolineae bacterium]
MKLREWFPALGFAAVAIVGVGGTAAFAPPAKEVQIVVIEHATTDAVTDTGAEGDSVGDILTFANEVFDESNTEVVGTDQGYCIRVVAGVSWECMWTIFLADGQMTVEGPFFDAGPSTLAITGGTGAYANAGGSMELTFNNEDGTEFVFTYNLVDNILE